MRTAKVAGAVAGQLGRAAGVHKFARLQCTARARPHERPAVLGPKQGSTQFNLARHDKDRLIRAPAGDRAVCKLS